MGKPARSENELIKTLVKPKSFGSESLQKITAEIPKDLVIEFNVLVATKSSRLNIELAEAMKFYLKKPA